MMTKKKLKFILNIALITCLCAVCATSAFDFNKDKNNVINSFCLEEVKNSDEASVILWNWILRYIRLSPKNAALHNIYQYDTAGIFVDLDDDGIRELLGTHRCTSVSGMGDCLLYILKYDEGAKLKYKPISKGLYFDADSPIEILEDKSAGFHKIQVLSLKEHHPKILSFDKRKGVYVEKK